MHAICTGFERDLNGNGRTVERAVHGKSFYAYCICTCAVTHIMMCFSLCRMAVYVHNDYMLGSCLHVQVVYMYVDIQCIL